MPVARRLMGSDESDLLSESDWDDSEEELFTAAEVPAAAPSNPPPRAPPETAGIDRPDWLPVPVRSPDRRIERPTGSGRRDSNAVGRENVRRCETNGAPLGDRAPIHAPEEELARRPASHARVVNHLIVHQPA